MVPTPGPVEFVTASSVRTDILQLLADGDRETGAILDSLSVSTSAVYSELGELEEYGLVRSIEDDWTLTGSGHILVDLIVQRESYERALGQLREYLRTHDTSTLPRTFRLRVDDLSDIEIIEATETKPHRAVTAVIDRIESADSAKIVSPIYVESYKAALSEVRGAQLVVDESVVSSASDSESLVDSGELADLSVRVAPVELAMAVTDSELLLSLPTLEGSYDPQTEIVAENDRARQWGSDLFERVWERATPLSAFDHP